MGAASAVTFLWDRLNASGGELGVIMAKAGSVGVLTLLNLLPSHQVCHQMVGCTKWPAGDQHGVTDLKQKTCDSGIDRVSLPPGASRG